MSVILYMAFTNVERGQYLLRYAAQISSDPKFHKDNPILVKIYAARLAEFGQELIKKPDELVNPDEDLIDYIEDPDRFVSLLQDEIEDAEALDEGISYAKFSYENNDSDSE